MPTVYPYNNIVTPPDVDQIHIDVANSTMTDKLISYCTWDKDDFVSGDPPSIQRIGETLCVIFYNELSASDKTELDNIVSNNTNQ